MHDAFVSVPKNVPCCIIKTLIVKNDIEEKYRNKRGQKLPILKSFLYAPLNAEDEALCYNGELYSYLCIK